MAMRITEERHFKMSDIVEGFREDKITNHVSSMNGKLDIRPKYQRQFVYGKKDEEAVIDSVINNFPINVMYWVKIGKDQAGDDLYEVLDGQQRLISLCHFYRGDFSVNGFTYNGLVDKNRFLQYDKLIVYICEGTEQEKLDWFERINKAGKELTKQEMRSAIFCGIGTTEAKKYFVYKDNNGSTAYSIDCQTEHPAKDYVCGKWERQDIYEMVLKWYNNSDKENDIRRFMGENKDSKEKADELFEYFRNVITWVKSKFPTYNAELMPKVEWGFLYNRFKDCNTLSSTILEAEVQNLLKDEEVQDKKNVYEYVLSVATDNNTNYSKLLNLRTFKETDKESKFEQQKHVCPSCMKKFKFKEMEGDHIIPWSNGGKTTFENLQMLCKRCNKEKSNKPFEINAEKSALEKVINMTQEEVDKLPNGQTI